MKNIGFPKLYFNTIKNMISNVISIIYIEGDPVV
uniref:Putative LOC102314664 [Haplochromis burtoni] n=1 Tax=Lepeophtheirus salmonis TaxID=72036 RepID=A0A0K2VEC3_LEPSM